MRNINISIHVSLRRRTSFFLNFSINGILQLTSPQGDEHFSSFNLLRIVYFNSRLREGTNTFFQVFFKRTFSITTHIPTRRRTDGIVASIAAPSFQITSPFGDELQILVLGTYSSYFNSHPRKETNIKFHCHLR